MKGRKDVRVDATKGNSITGMMTGRKEAGKKGTTEKAAGRESQRPGRGKRKELLRGSD